MPHETTPRRREEVFRATNIADLKTPESAAKSGAMPLIKLNRINKGGAVLLNSGHIVSIEIDMRTTTVTLAGGQLYSVEETPEAISGLIEQMQSDRIKNAIIGSGLVAKSS
jgi:uncharacterized protein YlzI (FlbEa/FlbD family)